jgi:hypothetical protein
VTSRARRASGKLGDVLAEPLGGAQFGDDVSHGAESKIGHDGIRS